MRTLRGDKVRYAALSGLFLGFAYLVRPEAMGYVILAAIWILASVIFRKWRFEAPFPGRPRSSWWPSRWRRRTSPGYRSTAGKSVSRARAPTITSLPGECDQGMGYSEASRGIGPNGEPEGPHLDSDQFEILKKESGGGRSLFNNILEDFPRRWLKLGWKAATLNVLGSPVLAILAMVGFLTKGVGNRKFLFEGFLLTVAAAYLLVLLSIGVMWPDTCSRSRFCSSPGRVRGYREFRGGFKIAWDARPGRIPPLPASRPTLRSA